MKSPPKKKRQAFALAPRVFPLFGANLTNPSAIGKRISNLEAGAHAIEIKVLAGIVARRANRLAEEQLRKAKKA